MPRSFRTASFRAATLAVLAWAGPAALPPAEASSHREAPGITKRPKVDATDFYMFRSYETGREGFVTLVACYQPLQAPYGGPNYFLMDPDALYEIHLDRDGNALEDLTFQLRFTNAQKGIALTVGPMGNQRVNEIPLKNAGAIGAGNTAALNVEESYSVTMVTGDRRTGTAVVLTHDGGQPTFAKPADNIGAKSIPDYPGYAAAHLFTLDIPGSPTGRIFVGQRKDPFVVNLGEIFDLVNGDFDPATPAFNPVGSPSGETDDLSDANVTAICLELPLSLVTNNGANPIVGGWTSASVRQARLMDPTPAGPDGSEALEGGPWTQVSRLGMPLVNEVVIGLSKKDRFNASEPKDDAQFADFVTHPTLPELLEQLFSSAGVQAPNAFPRTDLVQVFLTGVTGLNQPVGVVGSEMQRLNTTIAPVAQGTQNRLGVLAGDNAGFPNGRRPGDDVVDMALRVVMGVLLPAGDAPSGSLPFTDGSFLDATFTDAAFPYLKTPIPGSPN